MCRWLTNWPPRLKFMGVYTEASTGQEINWRVHRTPLGLFLFIGIGIMAGMFGLGAGWANVPVLNLVMGAPLKISVATSKFLLSITDTSAAWVYVNQGMRYSHDGGSVAGGDHDGFLRGGADS